MCGFRIACSFPILLATAGGQLFPSETFGAEAVWTSAVAESLPVLLPQDSEIQALRRQIDQIEALSRKLRDRHGRPVMRESERAGIGKGLGRVAEDLTQARAALNRLVGRPVRTGPQHLPARGAGAGLQADRLPIRGGWRTCRSHAEGNSRGWALI